MSQQTTQAIAHRDASDHPVPTGVANPLPVQFGALTTTTAATITEATKTVASAGTPEALGTGTFAEVFIWPLRTNTGQAYWGNSATNDSQNGLTPVVITAPLGKLIDISGIFIDVTVGGEGVRYTGTK